MPSHVPRSAPGSRGFESAVRGAAALVLLSGVVSTAALAAGGDRVPAQVLDLSGWKLALPVAAPGSSVAREVTQPELAHFSSGDFEVVGDAVAFRAPVGGATTKGSHYPRSELREMQPGGTREASWSTTSGTHVLVLREAVTHLPVAKPQVVTAQVHGASDDIMEVLADGTRRDSAGNYSICVRLNGARQSTCLDDHYRSGQFFTLRVVATGGHIFVSYNGTQVLDLVASASGCYFKAGAYTQSNPSKGDRPNAYGEVLISSLKVQHIG
jgi:hypothetical protein